MSHAIRADATFGVARSTAVMVGEWYLHARSSHHDAQVIEAYRQLQVETEHIFTLLTRDSRYGAVRVVFTRCAQPYESDEELILAVPRQWDARDHLSRRRWGAPSSALRL